MAPIYLISEFDLSAALYHLARCELEEDWRRETLKDVIAANIDRVGGEGFFFVGGGVYGRIEKVLKHQDNRFMVQLLIRPIEGMLEDPQRMTVLSVGL